MFAVRQILGPGLALTRIVAIVLAVAALSACGQKGPLYLPEAAPEAPKTPAR